MVLRRWLSATLTILAVVVGQSNAQEAKDESLDVFRTSYQRWKALEKEGKFLLAAPVGEESLAVFSTANL
jgi:hypothetical protein